MLRTNSAFLGYFEPLYETQQRKEEIIIREFSEGQSLLQQGQQAPKVYLIKEGITKCFFDEGGDKGFIVEFLGKGEVLGDIEVIKNRPCLCTIQALTPVQVYGISIPYIRSLLEKDLLLNKLLLEAYAERIINTSSRASFQQLHTVEHTLARLLEIQTAQALEISKEDMAAYLGITIRSLNRALKKLKPDMGN
jgi:CRP/FNR family transcriptional regulator, anaerobic regulatory protein